MGSRSEVERRYVSLTVEIEYQYDDLADPEKPHVVRYHGLVESGETYAAAIAALQAAIA